MGQWTSQDPAGFAAGDSNLYRYVTNSPTGGEDPSGLFQVQATVPPIRVWGPLSFTGHILLSGDINSGTFKGHADAGCGIGFNKEVVISLGPRRRARRSLTIKVQAGLNAQGEADIVGSVETDLTKARLERTVTVDTCQVTVRLKATAKLEASYQGPRVGQIDVGAGIESTLSVTYTMTSPWIFSFPQAKTTDQDPTFSKGYLSGKLVVWYKGPPGNGYHDIQLYP